MYLTVFWYEEGPLPATVYCRLPARSTRTQPGTWHSCISAACTPPRTWVLALWQAVTVKEVIQDIRSGNNSPPDKNKAQLLPTRTWIPRNTRYYDNSPPGPLGRDLAKLCKSFLGVFQLFSVSYNFAYALSSGKISNSNSNYYSRFQTQFL